MKQSRRDFLRHSGCALGATALFSSLDRFSLVNAMTPQATDYKALVCIFLFGGNDGNNTVIPYDGYAAYNAVRSNTSTLNIPQADLLPISPPSARAKFGLHPSLAELQTLFNQNKLAVLCNVGTLTQPLTKTQFLGGGDRPQSLFSHSDQQEQWQSSISSSTGQTTFTGWGGRLADGTLSLNGSNTFPMIVSVAGITLFTTGVTARPLVPSGGLAGFNNSSASTARYNALRQIIALNPNQTLTHSAGDIMASAIDNTTTLNQALSSGSALKTTFPNTSLGNQLKQIAQIIAARTQLGVQRQIFFASLGSFDTHTNQFGTQGSPTVGGLLQQVSQAMKAFYDATVEINVAPQVTTFTLSDFGRTFQPASGGGTDHAWGSHQFIMGGAVHGGDFYGHFPTLALGGPDDASDEGRWIPTTSVDQYGATLAQWYGLAPNAVSTVFPNIGRFSSSNLGFLM